MITRFNLSEWALKHQALILYFIVALFVAGVYSYVRLGQAEDPEFTFKVMVIRTLWPGATAKEVEQQVTERLEKKLQETPWFDYARSYSKPGESLVFVTLKDYTPPKAVPVVARRRAHVTVVDGSRRAMRARARTAVRAECPEPITTAARNADPSSSASRRLASGGTPARVRSRGSDDRTVLTARAYCIDNRGFNR